MVEVDVIPGFDLDALLGPVAGLGVEEDGGGIGDVVEGLDEGGCDAADGIP
jgi:hypothetical protein